jgi:hypothetical protein
MQYPPGDVAVFTHDGVEIYCFPPGFSKLPVAFSVDRNLLVYVYSI